MDSLSETLVALRKSTHCRIAFVAPQRRVVHAYAQLATFSANSTPAEQRRAKQFALASDNFAWDGRAWTQRTRGRDLRSTSWVKGWVLGPKGFVAKKKFIGRDKRKPIRI
jgi:hypothetical protein